MKGRSALTIVLAAGAALLSLALKPPPATDELRLRTEAFTENLVTGRARELYRMFVPAFREEVSFARFDSALVDWYAGRRVATGRARVTDVQPLSGHASTWIVFEDEHDYSYVYQNWLRTGDEWELVWLSNILDQSFQYGRSDTVELVAVAQAALRYLVEDGGLEKADPKLVLPETLLVVRREPGSLSLPSRPVVVRTPLQLRAGEVPDVPWGFQFALTRIYGRLAFCVVDVKRPRRSRDVVHRRSIQLYLERDGDGWRFHSRGKVW